MKVVIRWKRNNGSRRRAPRRTPELMSLLEIVSVSVGSVATYYVGRELLKRLRSR